jgi:hypothetical protein
MLVFQHGTPPWTAKQVASAYLRSVLDLRFAHVSDAVRFIMFIWGWRDR